MSAEKILVVDDEKELADLIELYLKNDGYEVYKYYNGTDALHCAEQQDVDLAILDIMLPDINGYTICKKIREHSFFPIIMLTAKIDDSSKIMGLTLGADDYITKPFNALEVVARVRSQLRRYKQYNTNSSNSVEEPEEYDQNGLYICPASHKCTLNGSTLSLTPFEFNILWYLCKNHGNVASAEELFENIWGEKFFESNNNTVMAHIARIREKMNEPARKPRYIKTVWGVGYKVIETETGSRAFHKQLAVKTTVQFITSVIVFEVAFVLLNLLSLVIVGATNLDQTKVFQAFKPFMIPMMVVISIVGCGYISYRFMLRPLRYLDEVAEAAQKLAHPTEAPIILSGELETIENDLNNVRKQTLQSKKSAQDAERRKEDLLVYLAHDLKTPLASVLGYLRLIEDEPQIPPELICKYSGIARKKAQRLEELINEFFEITRFSTQKLSLEPTRTHLGRMLMQITYEFNPILAEKGLEWDLQIAENIEIMCDANKLERAIDNVIRNAVTYCYPNTKIFFSLTQTNDSIRICVQNKGPTISPEKLERIFEQFYRLDTARSSETGGAGLGLAIAKEIVDLHHGTIAAYSEDENIQFTITLPSDSQKILRN